MKFISDFETRIFETKQNKDLDGSKRSTDKTVKIKLKIQ